MVFDREINLLVQNLLKNNPIFVNNGFYYKNLLELRQNGVSDHFVNMFYIRPLPKGDRKYSVKKEGNIITTTCLYRIVIQLAHNVSCPLEAIISQIYNYNVIGSNDDSSQIYKSEYNKDKEIDVFNLYSIDFEVSHESISDACSIKYITIC